jgi:purine-binding chemotaxis protein CheW
MDFLEIRKKAKERAAARARAGAGGSAAKGRVASAKVSRRARKGRGPSEDPVVTDADVVEGALLAEMQGHPPLPSERRGPPSLGDGFRIAARGPAPKPPEAAPPDAGRRGELRPPSGVPAAGAPAPRPGSDPLREFFYDEAESGSPIPDLGLYTAPRSGTAAVPEERKEYLTFHLGDEEYAVEIAYVREVLKAPVITEVPHAPAHILGVILVRGEVIPVHDPRRRLGLPAAPAPKGARVVICDAGRGPEGLLVDAVSHVVRLPPSAIETRPQGIGGIDSETLAGIGRDQDRFFILLDTAALFRGPAAPGPPPAPKGLGS